MTVDELKVYQGLGAALGVIVGSAILAWKARGRKERRAPYSPEKGAQPRVITRDEWHNVVNLVNTIPGISARQKRLDDRVGKLEREFQEQMQVARDQLQAFARLEAGFDAHILRWEEVGQEARDHRQRIEAHILRVEQKVDRER